MTRIKWTCRQSAVWLGIAFFLFSLPLANAAKRAGAPRAVRIEWPQGSTPSNASLLQPVMRRDARSGKLQLFFTAVADGTRNLWQAEPGEEVASDAETGIEWKNILWQPRPLTKLKAPIWADAIVADGVNGEPGVFCVTNALLRPASTLATAPQPEVGSAAAKNLGQIVYLHTGDGRAWAVTQGEHEYQPAVSPSGKRLAFVSSRAGLEAIFVQPLGAMPPDENTRRNRPLSISESARRVATLARQPLWLDEDTLLYISTRPGQVGIYRLDLANSETTEISRPVLVFSGAVRGQIQDMALSPDGRSLAIVANSVRADNSDDPGKIYLLSTDGTGIRAVAGTEGAAHPAFAPDGSALFFDNTLPAEYSDAASASQRLLWMVALADTPPIAQLQEARLVRNDTADGTLDIVGTAYSEELGPVDVKLEWAQGDQPDQWYPIAGAGAVASDAPLHTGVLAQWTPPERVGRWTLRLTATDASGDQAQSTLSLATPLPVQLAAAPSPVRTNGLPAPALLSATPVVPAKLLSGPLPAAVPPAPINTTQEPAAPPAMPVRQETVPVKNTPRSTLARGGGPLPFLPLPALPPAPGEDKAESEAVIVAPPRTIAPRNSTPRRAPARAPEELLSPLPPASLPSVDLDARIAPVLPPADAVTPPVVRSTPPEQETIAAPNSSYGAKISVTGVPDSVQRGASIPLQANLRNEGANGWFGQGENPVRLFYRWTDTSTGYRARWAYRWLPKNIAPGQSAAMSFPLATPPRAGQFRLDIGLLPMSGGSYQPPAATARVERWPGEFGTQSFQVSVR